MIKLSLPFLCAAHVALSLPTGPSSAQTDTGASGLPDTTARSTARRAMSAARLTASPPLIDGHLNDPAWKSAEAAGGFIQLQPDPGAPATERTEARVMYDDAAIYVGVRMFDSQPDSVVAALARRDQEVHSDWIYVGFDSYFDRRTAFVFALNPRGVKFDAILFDDTRSDDSWDAVWDGAARRDSLGWTAEFRIPLSQLRFAAASEQDSDRTWGIQFLRRIARRNEESTWSPAPRDENAIVSRFGELRGLRGLKAPRGLELQPYLMNRVVRAPGDRANPFFRANDMRADGGADVKYGVTSALTLTATVNPDFGQVEADPSVVNLTAFETFLPERRPFFVEGADIFRFAIGIGDGDGDNEGLFYSRRIGRAPQAGMPSGAAWEDVPEAAPILGAAKLSGKTARGWSLGFLNATTGAVTGRYVTPEGARAAARVEPLTNYAVGRLIKDFRAGESALGLIGTSTNRQLDDPRLDFLRSGAFSGGVSGRHRWSRGRYQLNGWLAGSHIVGDSSAIRIAQTSSARYFQRPEIAHRYDPTRTALSGWAGALDLLKMGGGHWRYGTLTNVRSPGFEVNDLGFQRGADHLLQAAFLGFDQYKPSPRFRNWNVNMATWGGWSFAGERVATGMNLNGGFQRPSMRGFFGGVNREFAALSPHALRGGPALRTPGSTRVWFNAFTDRRRALSGSLNGGAFMEDETGGFQWRVSPTLRARPSDRVELTVSPAYSHNTTPWQYVARRTVGGTPYYVFGALNQTTTSLVTRANYTFTPDLSFQLYLQPFISGGRYSAFREVRNPRAPSFEGRMPRYPQERVAFDAVNNRYTVDRDGDGVADFRFGNPDFNFKQLHSNAVLRWEYRPGSALFVVWSQGRSRRDAFGDYEFGRDASDLFAIPPTNVLLVKLNYWLGL